MLDHHACLECLLPDCNKNSPMCLQRDRDILVSEYGCIPMVDAGHRRGRCPSAYEIEIAFRRHGVCRGAISLGIRQSRFRHALAVIGLVPPEPRVVKIVRRKRP